MCPPALEKLQEIHALPGEAFQPKSGALVFFWLVEYFIWTLQCGAPNNI